MDSDGGRGELPALARVLVTSRTWREYLAMFALSEAEVLSGPVLDVAAGAADFACWVAERGGTAVAADPLYAAGVGDLGGLLVREQERAAARAAACPSAYDFSWAGGVDRYASGWRQAVGRFLADHRRSSGRYVATALPQLGFADRSFALVVVANLLFTYPGLFDQRTAIRELIRVCRGEVRIHPLVDTTHRVYPRLASLVEELAGDGIRAAVREVSYQLIPGSRLTLVCRRAD